MSTIKCSKCNKPVESSDKFCPHCGALVQQSSIETLQCTKCSHENPASVSFCESCGTSLKSKEGSPIPPPEHKKDNEPKTFTSAGNYSGTMVKGKTSKSWKVLKIILLIIGILAVIVFAIWYKTDPNAKETLGNIIFGLVIMLIFGLIIWWKNRKNIKKGSKTRGDTYNRGQLDDDDDDYNNDNDDYNNDNDDNDDD